MRSAREAAAAAREVEEPLATPATKPAVATPPTAAATATAAKPTRRRLLSISDPPGSSSSDDLPAAATHPKARAATSGQMRIGVPRSDLSGVGVTSQAYSPYQQWVVLRSLSTNTFVSVEPPPHTEAMVVHGRGESISLNNVFGFLRGGFLWAKSTASLLNVCSMDNEICTGYLEREGDPHLKRLQAPMESAYYEFRSVTLPPAPPPGFKR